MEETQSSGSFVNRMVRAAKLESDLYEEVEADKSANKQAFLVVVLFTIAMSVGEAIAIKLFGTEELKDVFFVWSLLGALIANMSFFLIFSLLTYWVGSTILKGPETSADWGELIRTLGFSTSPGVLGILSVIPLLGLVVRIWMIITAVIAVRQALDFTTGRSIATCLICILPSLIVTQIVLVLVLGFVGA